MEILTGPSAVSALSKAFSDILSAGCESFAEFEPRALELARRSAAEAMSLALEAMDAELLASRPAGTTVHSHRPRTLATMTGDVRFSRTVLLEPSGSTTYPLDEALGLPMGDRVSPSAREFLVTCGADVPFERTSRLMAMGGGSRVSATTVMRSVRRAGESIARAEREAARALFSDGVAPGEFWREAVAQVGSRFDLGRVERVSLGTDGEAQYVNGISAMSFAAESDGHIDPFHVDRAVARCAPAGSRLGWAMLQVLEAGGPEACAFAIESLASVGALRGGSD